MKKATPSGVSDGTPATSRREYPEPNSESPAGSRRSAERVERPRELQGSTWRIPFENQNLYVTVNHDVVVVAVQLQPDAAVTVSAGPTPPAADTVGLSGATANAQPAACVTVTVLSATVSVPVRTAPELADTENCVVPDAVPVQYARTPRANHAATWVRHGGDSAPRRVPHHRRRLRGRSRGRAHRARLPVDPLARAARVRTKAVALRLSALNRCLACQRAAAAARRRWRAVLRAARARRPRARSPAPA